MEDESSSRRSSQPLPYVGRSGELAWLGRVLDDSLSGQPRIALVSGEPGIGKSQLLREFRKNASRTDVITGTSSSHFGDLG